MKVFRQVPTVRNVPGAVRTIRFLRSLGRVIRRTVSTPPRYNSNGKILRIPGIRNLWVGYYDHSPFLRQNEDIILTHSTEWPAWRKPNPNVPVEILLVDWRTGQIVSRLGKTTAWNWQQGARALWIPEKLVGFNIYDAQTDTYKAKIVDPSSGLEEILPLPIQEVDQHGRIYSISYEALRRIRPDYGYYNKSASQQDVMGNRIKSYCIKTGQITDYVGISELVQVTEEATGCELVLPKINHLMASPSGEKIIFLFRYYRREKRITDLYVLYPHTGKWHLLIANAGVSHASWLGEDSLLLTMRGTNGFGYYTLEIATGHAQFQCESVDGHPSSFGKKGFITDSYPDEYGMRDLVMRSWTSPSEARLLSTFAEPLFFQGESRCDLHPTLSPAGTFIQVDIAIRHRRSIAIFDVRELGIE